MFSPKSNLCVLPYFDAAVAQERFCDEHLPCPGMHSGETFQLKTGKANATDFVVSVKAKDKGWSAPPAIFTARAMRKWRYPLRWECNLAISSLLIIFVLMSYIEFTWRFNFGAP